MIMILMRLFWNTSLGITNPLICNKIRAFTFRKFNNQNRGSFTFMQREGIIRNQIHRISWPCSKSTVTVLPGSRPPRSSLRLSIVSTVCCTYRRRGRAPNSGFYASSTTNALAFCVRSTRICWTARRSFSLSIERSMILVTSSFVRGL